jgi:PII-like signaling protein
VDEPPRIEALLQEVLILTVYVGRQERAASGARAFVAVCVWGFHGDHPPHGDRLLQARRHVPVVTVVIDTDDRIARAFAIVDEMTADRGLVTSEMVPALAQRAQPQRHLRLSRHSF